MTPPASAQTQQPEYVLDQLDLDLRADLVAADLLSRMLPLDKLILNPTGPDARAYSKDHNPLTSWLIDGSTAPYWRLDTPREGIYDQLPPYLFHAPGAGEAGPTRDAFDVDSILDSVQRTHEIEREARQFFLPFDTELNYLRVLRALRDQQNDRLENADTLIDQFAVGWPILTRLDPLHRGLFVQLLPLIHQLRSNLNWVSRLLGMLFVVPMRLESGRHLNRPAVTDDRSSLDGCRLGIDAIMGNSFDDGRNGIRLIIGPVPDNRVADFLPHTDTMQLIDELLAYFLPAANEVSRVVLTERPASPTPDHIDYLGFNSYL
ncbi:type VI secretion system baseplate subunit TssG [uncultured Fibrella sp.]|uniref:type VI secretion system baseplate subunit TssG n=1 Tax=uncultured Fibrella sp. TaxID=1284596 RepID=UPI0035CBA60F